MYEGESMSNQPVPFPMDRDAFMPCFNTCFIRGYEIARLLSQKVKQAKKYTAS